MSQLLKQTQFQWWKFVALLLTSRAASSLRCDTLTYMAVDESRLDHLLLTTNPLTCLSVRKNNVGKTSPQRDTELPHIIQTLHIPVNECVSVHNFFTHHPGPYRLTLLSDAGQSITTCVWPLWNSLQRTQASAISVVTEGLLIAFLFFWR